MIQAKIGKIPVPVLLLGLVSFFNDIASEMLYPVMPIFLTQILGAPIFVVGIIDGVAEGLSSSLKTVFGYLSDKTQKRKPFIVSGYFTSALSKLVIATAFTWPMVFFGRVLDRFGKGMRTGARDAMLLEYTNEHNKGFVFGVHRSLDSSGAIIGPIIALFLLHAFSDNIRIILAIAAIPSFIGLLLFFFIREARKHTATHHSLSFWANMKTLSPQLKLFFLTIGIFSLGNSTDSFLILRSKELGLTITGVVLVYIVYNIFYAVLSTPAGSLADKIGARYVYPLGLVIFALVYFGFAFNTNPAFLWLLFAVYGGYIALTDGVSKALIGGLIKHEEAGTVYGVSQTIISITTLLASVIGGLLWSAFGSYTTFLFGAICSLVSLITFLPLINTGKKN